MVKKDLSGTQRIVEVHFIVFWPQSTPPDKLQAFNNLKQGYKSAQQAEFHQAFFTELFIIIELKKFFQIVRNLT